MKKLAYSLFILAYVAPSNAWTWAVDQKVSFDNPTHHTLENLATTFERSTDNLSQSIKMVTEQGISSLPLNIDSHVWQELKILIIMIAIVFLGTLLSYWGLSGIRKYFLFTIFQESINTFIKNLLGSVTFTGIGFMLIVLSNKLAHLIVLLHT